MPKPSTVMDWVKADPVLAEQYARAKDSGIDELVEEMLDIADSVKLGSSEQINAARLRIDTRKWYASKLKAKVYGDKPAEVNVETHLHNHVSVEQQKKWQERERAAMEARK